MKDSPITTGPTGPVVTLESGDPTLSGPITFRVPTFYEQIAIERRMAELANLGGTPSAPRITVEQLTPFGRYVVEAVAHLEFVVVHAPAGFYEDTTQGPELAVGRLASIEQDVLVAAYQGYNAYRERFRRARGEHSGNDAKQPSSATPDDRGTTDA